MANIFKVRDENNRFLRLIDEHIVFSEVADLTVITCKLCNEIIVMKQDMMPIRATAIRHIIKHIHENPKLLGEICSFTEMLQNNELVPDENEESKLK